MLPLVNSINPLPVQPALVATAMTDAGALRAPYDNVAPTVSQAAIDPNAQQPPAFAVPEQNDPTDNSSANQSFALFPPSPAATAAQAAFLAQLISQEVPAAMQETFRGVLAQYETMVVNGFTKYKPSNAGIPKPAPASAFAELLHQDNAAPSVPIPAPVAQPAPNLAFRLTVNLAPAQPPAASSAYAATQTRNASAPIAAAVIQSQSQNETPPARISEMA